MNRFVTSYINPDSDGVCTAIGFAFYKQTNSREEWIPVFSGALQDETLFILERFGIAVPLTDPNIDFTGSVIALMDTHHRDQILHNLPLEQVIEIIDHHPAGDPKAFPNAAIRNESVGAAATLLTEIMKEKHINPTHSIAGSLAAAIVSNTLNFTTPSTTQRDKTAFAWLTRYSVVEDDFIKSMFEARSRLSSRSSLDLLQLDYKEFTIDSLKIGISQLETVDSSVVLSRPDLAESLMQLKQERGIPHVFLNVVNILTQKSVVVCPDPKTRVILEQALGVTFDANHQAAFSRILLRKTDLIPSIQRTENLR